MGCACCEGLCIGAACPYEDGDALYCEKCGNNAEFEVDGKPMCWDCTYDYINECAKERGIDDDTLINAGYEKLADILKIDLEEI